jgi:hypothetical protein
MQRTSSAHRFPFGRLILSLTLGALTGVYAGSAVPGLDGLIALILLYGPPLVSLLRDNHIHRSVRALVPVALIIALPVLALGWLGVRLAVPFTLSGILVSVSSNLQGLAPFLISGVAALSFGSRPLVPGQSSSANFGLSIGCAASAWLGVGLRSFSQSALAGQFSSNNGNDFAGLILYLLIVLFVIGFGLSALEGIGAASLRAWVVRRAA